MSATHKAVVLLKAGQHVVQDRATPEPGPDEVLINVKAVALNPVDCAFRDLGITITRWPTVIGSDAAGIVAKVGSNVREGLQVGSRVMAFASGYYHDSDPDYGAFQEYALARKEGVLALPGTMSFEQGASMPLGLFTALAGWISIGVSLLNTKHDAQDEKEAVLIWGGASSVGTFAIQSAKAMGYIVYTTASSRNHEYMKELGADVVFDYTDDKVVAQIIDRMNTDKVKMRTAYFAAGHSALRQILDVLKVTKGLSQGKVAHAPPLAPDAATEDGIDVTFVTPSADATERARQFHDCFQVWTKHALETGALVPSPPIKVAKGLEAVNASLDTLKAGASATKYVVQLTT